MWHVDIHPHLASLSSTAGPFMSQYNRAIGSGDVQELMCVDRIANCCCLICWIAKYVISDYTYCVMQVTMYMYIV